MSEEQCSKLMTSNSPFDLVLRRQVLRRNGRSKSTINLALRRQNVLSKHEFQNCDVETPQHVLVRDAHVLKKNCMLKARFDLVLRKTDWKENTRTRISKVAVIKRSNYAK